MAESQVTLVSTSDYLNLHISTSKNAISFNEKRFPKDLTVSSLKAKLEMITGGNCNTMQIEVYNNDNKVVCSLDNDSALLGSYPIDDGMRLHVIDNFPIAELDTANVEKFELTPDQYSSKSDTVRAYMKQNKMGAFNEEAQLKKEQKLQEQKQLAECIPIGSRCKVVISKMPDKIGTVMYSGEINTLSGYFIGVKYDEPLGKNDGSYKGERYFKCPDNYGAFVRPECIVVGDFQEEDYGLDEI